MSWDVYYADCTEFLATSYGIEFDACVTDPPYSYNFMGNSWDNLGRGFQGWCSEWGAETLRVLKPGAYALVFGGARTYHRLTCGLEDAGFEIRDCIHWIYGNGMPKHRSCLKPACEPIIVARKPAPKATAFPGLERCNNAGGRWPANLLLSCTPDCSGWEHVPDCSAGEMDRQSGYSVSRKQPKTMRKGGRATNFAMSTSGASYSDSGGASRYFPVFMYQPRAGASERPSVNGVSHPTVKPLGLMRWLVRLVTPEGGYVLDPFAGSGTTAEACELEGFDSLLIESDPRYIPLINKRMSKYEREAA